MPTHLPSSLLLVSLIGCGHESESALECEQVGQVPDALYSDITEAMLNCGRGRAFGECMEQADQVAGTGTVRQEWQLSVECPSVSISNLNTDRSAACGHADGDEQP